MSRVLIAGCGRVGTALAAKLAQKGHVVWGLRRSNTPLPPLVHLWRADLSKAESLRDPPAKFDILFYTASADKRDERAYRLAYIDGVEALQQALTKQPPVQRAFFTSSTAVYGQSNGQWIDETSNAEPKHFNGKIMLEAEKRFADAPWEATIVRFSGIYGNTSTTLIDRVMRGKQAATTKWTNRIHVDDCARVLAHLLSEDKLSELYLASDPMPASMTEVATWLSRELKTPTPPPEDPRSPADLGKRCNVDRLLATGYRFIYPSYKEGYSAIINALPKGR